MRVFSRPSAAAVGCALTLSPRNTEKIAAALGAAVKALTPPGQAELPKQCDTQRLTLTTPPEGDFDFLDLLGHFVLTLVPGTGWAATVLLPADTLKRLIDGEAQRGGCHDCTKRHTYPCGGGVFACPHGPAHAPGKPKPMAQAEEAAAAQAEQRSGPKMRGEAQLHTTIKGACGVINCHAHCAPPASRPQRAARRGGPVR